MESLRSLGVGSLVAGSLVVILYPRIRFWNYKRKVARILAQEACFLISGNSLSDPIQGPLHSPGLDDFELRPEDRQEINLEWILGQSNVTLYTVDLGAGCVVFAVTPQFRNLYTHQRFYVAQLQLAASVCVVPVGKLRELARRVREEAEKDPRKPTVVLVYAPENCGSRDLAHFFERIPGVLAVVEPQFLLTMARLFLSSDEGKRLFDELFEDLWAIFLHFTLKSLSGVKAQEKASTLVVKPHPLVFQIAEAIQKKCPTKCIFMYRSPRLYTELTVANEHSSREVTMSRIPLISSWVMQREVRHYRQHLCSLREFPTNWKLRGAGFHSLAAMRWLGCIAKYNEIAVDPLFEGQLCAAKFESLCSHFQKKELLKALAHFAGFEATMSEKDFEAIVNHWMNDVKIAELPKDHVQMPDRLWEVATRLSPLLRTHASPMVLFNTM